MQERRMEELENLVGKACVFQPEQWFLRIAVLTMVPFYQEEK